MPCAARLCMGRAMVRFLLSRSRGLPTMQAQDSQAIAVDGTLEALAGHSAVEAVDHAMRTVIGRYRLIALYIGLAVLGANVLTNFIAGHYLRSMLFAPSVIIFLGLLPYAHRSNRAHFVPDLLGLIALYLNLLVVAWTNDGFSDSRTVTTSIIFLFASHLAFTGVHYLVTVALYIAFVGLTLVFTELGLLAEWHVSDGATQGRVFTLLGLLIFCTCLYLNWMRERTQKRLLEVTAETAEKARRTESLFLSNMSHEIRNPLNGLLALLREARQEINPSKRDSCLASAEQAGDHLREIVDDILELKQLEAGKSELRLVPTEPRILFSNIATTARALLTNQDVLFVVHADFEQLPPALNLDSTKVYRVVLNLLSNAIKFTPNGQITLSIEYDMPLGVLSITVSDTGIGISESDREILFQRFTQVDRTATKRFQGTGLGLAIVRELTALLGGKVTLVSELNRGSTFTITLPAAPAELTPERGPATHQIATPGEGLRLLCIDDDPINLKALSLTLYRLGASVTLARSGEEALSLLDTQAFDLVMTDITMPGMSGEALQARIHARAPDLPVVAVTGNALATDRRRYLESGFKAVVAKPINPEELHRVLTQAQRRKPASGDNHVSN